MINNYPKVSVVTITYGHEKYIIETLDGVLMQKYKGDIEFVISNDNSPDSTNEIIENYFLGKKIPENFTIKYLYHKVNRGMVSNFTGAIEEATGTYVTLCEGDDYWIDPLKIQKQVDFLEEHLDFSMTVGGYSMYNTIDDTVQKCIIENTPEIGVNGYEVTFDMFLKQWFTKTLTLMFRKSHLERAFFNNYIYTRDVHLIYHLLQKGKCMYLLENFGIYRVHDGGVHSGISEQQQRIVRYHVTKEIYLETKDQRYRSTFLNVAKQIYYLDQMPSHREELFKHILRLSKTPEEYVSTCKTIFGHFKNRFIKAFKNLKKIDFHLGDDLKAK